jgi:hypothetical protein
VRLSRTISRIIDLTVFAPIGLISVIREQLPNVDKQMAQNRQAVINRIQLAQLAGRVAAQRLAEAGKATPGAALHDADSAATAAVARVDPVEPLVPVEVIPAGLVEAVEAVASHPGGRVDAGAVTQAEAAARTAAAPAAEDLPISDYESLAAIHVVHRLGTLRPDELEMVRSFEQANRSRRTILAKIEQLQDART